MFTYLLTCTVHRAKRSTCRVHVRAVTVVRRNPTPNPTLCGTDPDPDNNTNPSNTANAHAPSTTPADRSSNSNSNAISELANDHALAKDREAGRPPKTNDGMYRGTRMAVVVVEGRRRIDVGDSDSDSASGSEDDDHKGSPSGEEGADDVATIPSS